MPTTDLGGPIRRRTHLRERADVRFVDPTRFLALLVSTRRLERRDDRAAGLRGLHDAEAGVTYVIEEEELGRPAARRAPAAPQPPSRARAASTSAG